MEALPQFRYHPDPVRTGMLRRSDDQCQVCEQSRGYVYAGNVYSEANLEHVCPWCIADGSAALRFDASFADPHSLSQASLPDSIIEEVSKRTPAYESWQSEVWLAHCNDACEFHGDAEREDLERIDSEERTRIQQIHSFPPSDWEAMVQSYQPAGQPAFYKFACRHCATVLYHVDYT